MITENVSTLKMHRLSQEQYDRECEEGNIDATALYLTPDNAGGGAIVDNNKILDYITYDKVKDANGNIIGITILKCTTSISGTVVIPDIIEGYPVIALSSDTTTNPADGLFSNCNNITSVIIPDSVTYIGRAAFNECNNLENVVLSKSVKTIDALAFRSCTKLSNINIPEGVTKIGNSAFRGSGLKEIIIPDSVIELGTYAFAETQAIKIVVGKGLTCLTNATFSTNRALKYVMLPDTLIEISDYTTSNGEKTYGTFSACSSLTEIYVPKSLTSIEETTFKGSSDNFHIKYEGTKEEWDAVIKPNLPNVTISYNQELATKEYVESYADNDKLTRKQGQSIVVDDVSPIEHELKVRLIQKNLFDGELKIWNNLDRIMPTKCIKVKPNTWYRISVFDYTIQHPWFTVYGNHTGMVGAASDTNLGSMITTFNSGEFEYIWFREWYSMTDDGITLESKVQVEEIASQTASGTEYAPYIDLSTVKVSGCGKNLVDINTTNTCYTSSLAPRPSSQWKIENETLFIKYGYYGGAAFWDTEAKILPKGSYTLSCDAYIDMDDATTDKRVAIGAIFEKDGNMTEEKTTKTLGGLKTWERVDYTFTLDEDLKLSYLQLQPVGDGNNYTNVQTYFKNIQIEISSVMTEYESYNGRTTTSMADGTVEGLTSVSPNMTILTDTEGVTIDCAYYRGQDIDNLLDKVFATKKYVNDVISNIDISDSEGSNIKFYYPALIDVINDINNNTIGTNATATKDTAIASLHIKDGQNIVTLLEDTTIITGNGLNTSFPNHLCIIKDMMLDLNGKCITLGTGVSFRTEIEGINVTFIGETRGSKIIKHIEGASTQNEFLCVSSEGIFRVIGGEYDITVDECNKIYVAAFLTNPNGKFELIDCKISAYLHTGTGSSTRVFGIVIQDVNSTITNCISTGTFYNSTGGGGITVSTNGSLYAKNSKFFGYSPANKAGLGVLCGGRAELIDCIVYGTQSGVQYATGKYLHIDGGIYEGAKRGGLFLTTVKSGDILGDVFVENATISAAHIRGIDKTDSNYQECTSGITVYNTLYLDNCIIKGGSQSVLHMTGTSNNNVYMTNCTIDKNTTNFATADEITNNIIGLTQSEIDAVNVEEGDDKTLPRNVVKIDSSTSKLYLGKGNNFKRNHLLVHRPAGESNDISTFIENTDQTFYVRELVEE